MNAVRDLLIEWSKKDSNTVLDLVSKIKYKEKNRKTLVHKHQLKEEICKNDDRLIKLIDDLSDRGSLQVIKNRINESIFFVERSIEGKRVMLVITSDIEDYLMMLTPKMIVNHKDSSTIEIIQSSSIIDVEFEGESLNKKALYRNYVSCQFSLHTGESFISDRSHKEYRCDLNSLVVESPAQLDDLLDRGDLSISMLYDEVYLYCVPKQVINTEDGTVLTLRKLDDSLLDKLYFIRHYGSSKFMSELGIKDCKRNVCNGYVFEGKMEFPFVRTLIKLRKILGQESDESELAYLAHLITIDGSEEQWPVCFENQFKRIREEFSK